MSMAGMKGLFPYSETTGGVTVRVSVSFLPEQSEPEKSRWFWAYHIRIENDGPLAVQLMTTSNSCKRCGRSAKRMTSPLN